MAEFVMKDLVRRAGRELEFVIDSAACHSDETGSDTHYGTKRKLREMGVPFAPRRARLATRGDYEKYDLLIGMDGENMADLRRLSGGDPLGKCRLLLSFAGKKRDVADPWYTGDFDATWNDVLEGCTALLNELAVR